MWQILCYILILPFSRLRAFCAVWFMWSVHVAKSSQCDFSGLVFNYTMILLITFVCLVS